MKYNKLMKILNKKALFDYEVMETFEAGVVLTGSEVKSLKKGSGSLTGSRVVVGDPEEGREGMYVIGMTISPYQPSEDYDPIRSRKLLLKASEIQYLRSKLATKGLTVVPTACYTKRDLIKLEIALVRGKKRFEKREEEKKKEVEGKLRQVIKNQGRRSQ